MADMMVQQARDESLRGLLRGELDVNHLMKSLNAGLVNGIFSIVLVMSFAAMIFSGDLSHFTSKGIGFFLLAAVGMNIIAAFTSSYEGSIVLPQDVPAAILALAGAAISGEMSAASPPESILYTVLAVIAISTILTGIFLFLLGRFRLGDMVRYVPYSVIGGFLAGVGWLLLTGGIGVMIGEPFKISNLPRLIGGDAALLFAPGAALGTLIFVMLRRYSHFLIMPSLLLGAIALFHFTLFLLQISPPEAESLGWTVGPFPEGALFQLPAFSSFSGIDWSVVSRQIPTFGTIMIMSVICLLINESSLELIVRKDIDLNRELRSSGIANIFAGLVGGSPGYLGLGPSALGYRLGSESRLMGVVIAAVLGVPLFFGASVISLFPRFVLGALLFFLGLDLIVEWVFEARRRLPKFDFFLVLTILFTVSSIGFLEGIGLGIVVALLFFVISYSRIHVVKYALTGAEYRSHVERAAPYRKLLTDKGDLTHLVVLQGFIFFGTAHRLLRHIKDRIENSKTPVRYIILDFREVEGFDVSAANSFEKMARLQAAKNFTLIFTHLSEPFRQRLERGMGEPEGGASFRGFPTMDEAAEWCEDQILAAELASLAQTRVSLPEKYGDAFFDAVYGDLMDHLERMEAFENILVEMSGHMELLELEKGRYLIRQNDPPAGFYFIEAGQVTVQLENEEGKTIRLRKMNEGTIIGEMGLYLGYRASASVITNGTCKVRFLSLENLKTIETTEPPLAASFHRFIARTMCERLRDTTGALQALLEQ